MFYVLQTMHEKALNFVYFMPLQIFDISFLNNHFIGKYARVSLNWQLEIYDKLKYICNQFDINFLPYHVDAYSVHCIIYICSFVLAL